MKSPFPGMDPYLESHWGDVHTSLMVYASNQINVQLPDELVARVREATGQEIEDEAWRTVYPDVRVVEERGAWPGESRQETSVIEIAEPCVLLLEDEPRTERHIEIIDTSDGGRVVTAIEVLRPANKVGRVGRKAYKCKQREFLDAGVNLVEIDLIREGEFVMAAPEDHIPRDYRTPYLICIRRADQLGRVELYRAPLRERLPNIPIPLREGDKDVVLRLQPLIDDCYRDGRYHRIDYRADPRPLLGEDDARWADELLRQHHRR
jgi:hypothetical protein